MFILFCLAFAADCATVEGDQLVVSTPFRFASRSSELLDEGPVLEVLCALQADPARTLQVEVHTDSMGSDSYNLRASQARADAIREAILKRGVAEGRVTAVGYGETMPVAPNDTPAGRASNRRIELHLAPPSERPPRPAQPPMPEPAMAPAPVPQGGPAPVDATPPPPTLCDELDQALVVGERRMWTFPPPASEVVAEVAGCLAGWDVDRQEDSLYAARAGWSVAVREEGGAVVVGLGRAQ